MNSQERKVAFVVLTLLALGVVFINNAKPRLGNPGLAFEAVPLTNEVGGIVRTQRVSFPAAPPGFRSFETPITKVEAYHLPADTEFGRRVYVDQDGFTAQMSAVMMRTDRTSIHRPQVCILGQGWAVERTEIIDVPIPSPAPYNLKVSCLISSKDWRDPKTEKMYKLSSVYIYWFVSENRLVAVHPEAIWFITQDLLTTGTLYPWAYVSCFAQCAPGQEQVLIARMKRLISATVPSFQLTHGAPKQTAFLKEPSPLN